MSTAADQVGRLLALVPYIQSRQEVSVEQAAADFGVRPQQIVKDLNVLWFCGLPGLGMGDLIDVDMDALDGDGVIRVSNADYLSRPLRLGSTEASALIVALRALREASDEAVRPIVDRALVKLETAAGEGAALAARVDIHVDATAPEVNRLRATLDDALTTGRQVRIGYYVPARDEITERVVDPLRVVQAEGNTYLEAWCRTAEGQRLFRLDRMSQAEVLDEAVTDHSDVPPRDLSAGLFQASPDDTLVSLRLRPTARWVAEYYPVESFEELGDGSLRITLRVGDPGWLTRLMLRIGGGAQIEEPAELAEVVRRAAVDALANYV